MKDNILDNLDDNKHLRLSPYFIKFGLIAGFIYIIASIFQFIFDQEYNKVFGYLLYLAPIISMILCLSTYKKENGNRLIGSKGFQMGFMVFFIYSIIAGLFLLLYINVINPDFIDGLKDLSISQMEDRGMSDETIASAMSVSAIFMSPMALVLIGFISNLIVGVIISGITAPIMKTQKS